MNEIDKKILSIIQEQGHISYADLGKEVGLSVSAINERLKKLENKKIIKGWGARVDAKALGLEVLAFIFLQHERPAHQESFKNDMSKLSEVEECHHITGEWSYLLKIREKTIADLEKLINTKIRSSKGIARIQTIIVLSSPKDWSPHMIR